MSEMRTEKTARAIITLGSSVLLSRAKTESFWILPGGHCEAGEHPADTVKRELREETGREVSSLQYLTTLHNDFDQAGVHIQEELALFRATLYPLLQEDPAQSREDHLVFAWVPLAELALVRILPPAIVPFIVFAAGV